MGLTAAKDKSKKKTQNLFFASCSNQHRRACTRKEKKKQTDRGGGGRRRRQSWKRAETRHKRQDAQQHEDSEEQLQSVFVDKTNKRQEEAGRPEKTKEAKPEKRGEDEKERHVNTHTHTLRSSEANQSVFRARRNRRREKTGVDQRTCNRVRDDVVQERGGGNRKERSKKPETLLFTFPSPPVRDKPGGQTAASLSAARGGRERAGGERKAGAYS